MTYKEVLMLQDHTGLSKTVGEQLGEMEVSEIFKSQKETVSAVLTWLSITQLMSNTNDFDFENNNIIFNKILNIP